MSLPHGQSLGDGASRLLQQMIDKFDPYYGLGSMTCSVYDTAWVAMVSFDVNGHRQRLFPKSFQYLLGSQQDDGGWQAYPT